MLTGLENKGRFKLHKGTEMPGVKNDMAKRKVAVFAEGVGILEWAMTIPKRFILSPAHHQSDPDDLERRRVYS